ncbi:macro domain-containing protein [Streptosporangium sp. NPDC002544]|uniref:macro domain-containing protein n=1 Tax=Streptosporangium sp. NPDC002544 TaxID=3154538 RepID=UPI00331E38F5
MATSRLLDLAGYRQPIDLDRPFHPAAVPAPAAGLGALARTVLGLLETDPAAGRLGLPPGRVEHLDDGTSRRLLRAVLTVRAPGPLPEAAVAPLDALLGGERTMRGSVDASTLPVIAEQVPRTAYPAARCTELWRGDITTLAADAIANAANSALLGCYRPMHPCVDNAIHNAAGPRMRDDCAVIMTLQGSPEPTGTAKITRGYHLPARYVLHTVGPVVDGPLGAGHAADLAGSYRSCLEVAAAVDGVRTVAFCGISTGVFGYPKPAAARVALNAVADWMEAHPGRLDRVVFNVYGADDHTAYLRALTDWTRRS